LSHSPCSARCGGTPAHRLRKQCLAARGIQLQRKLRPAALQAGIGPGVLLSPAHLALVGFHRDRQEPGGEGADKDIEVVPHPGIRQVRGQGRRAPSKARCLQSACQYRLKCLSRVAQRQMRWREHTQRNAHGLHRRQRLHQTRQGGQARPGGSIQPIEGRRLLQSHPFGALQHLGGSESRVRLSGEATHHQQIANVEFAPRIQAQEGGCVVSVAAQHPSSDRAVRRFDASQLLRLQPSRVDRRISLPGLKAQGKPLAQGTRRAGWTRSEHRAAGRPALADGVTDVCQRGRRDETQAGMVPADLKADPGCGVSPRPGVTWCCGCSDRVVGGGQSQLEQGLVHHGLLRRQGDAPSLLTMWLKY